MHGWMRVAMLDMRDRSSQYPQGLERVHPGRKLCVEALILVAPQVFFNNYVTYDQVCGKIIAYQVGSTDSFG